MPLTDGKFIKSDGAVIGSNQPTASSSYGDSDIAGIISDVSANTAKVTNATHTGDVTGSGALTIANDAVTNAKAANMATATIKGRATAGTGDPEDLTAAQVRTLLNVENGADVTDTANVTAAGALMDSEVTNLADLKAFDPADYATSAQGSTADTAVQPSDNISDLTNDAGYISEVEGTSVKSTGEAGGSKFLREDGDGTCSWQSIPGGGDALTSSPLSQFAATTSSQLAGVLSDETGSGAAVFATSPTLVTPALGTPASGVLTNCTGYGLDGGIAVSDESTSLTASTSVPLATIHAQRACTIAEVLIGVTTAPTGSTLTADVHLNGTTIFSTKPTIDASEKTSVTAATASVLSTTSIAKGDLVEFFCDSVGAAIAGAGLKFYINYTK